MLLFESWLALGSRRVIPYSPIKLLEFSSQPIRSRSLDSCCCCVQKTVDVAASSPCCDGSILFLQRNITV